MFEFLAKYAEELINRSVEQTASQLRKEVDYAAAAIKAGIEDGIKAGFDSVRKAAFYLMVATASTIVSLIFMTWGLAQIFAEYFKSQGTGFLVFGFILLVAGILCFGMSRPK